MPWETVKPSPHRCITPILGFVVLQGAGEGSVWRCDKCQARHTIVRGPDGLSWSKMRVTARQLADNYTAAQLAEVEAILNRNATKES